MYDTVEMLIETEDLNSNVAAFIRALAEERVNLLRRNELLESTLDEVQAEVDELTNELHDARHELRMLDRDLQNALDDLYNAEQRLSPQNG